MLPVLYTIPLWNLTRGVGDRKEVFIPETGEWINFRWVKRSVKGFDPHRYYQRWVLNKTVESEWVVFRCQYSECGSILDYNMFGGHKLFCSRRCQSLELWKDDQYQKKTIGNNPVLQEGGLTLYLKNHPERGLENRLKAYEDGRVGFKFMHSNPSSSEKWKDSMKPFYESGGSTGLLHKNPEWHENWKKTAIGCQPGGLTKYLHDKGIYPKVGKASKISRRFFTSLSKYMSLMGLGFKGEFYYGDYEFLVKTGPSVGDVKDVRFLDFYASGLSIIVEFQGDYWHPRDTDKYGIDKVKESVTNDEIRRLAILNSLPGSRFYYVTESDYRDRGFEVIREILEDIEIYLQCV
jgi:endogenous inhibitor of DNA gyrase (YacG/DUF329 family)